VVERPPNDIGTIVAARTELPRRGFDWREHGCSNCLAMNPDKFTTRCRLRRFKKPTGQKPRAVRSGGSDKARRRTLLASSTGPPGCLSAGIFGLGRLKRMPCYAFRRADAVSAAPKEQRRLHGV